MGDCDPCGVGRPQKVAPAEKLYEPLQKIIKKISCVIVIIVLLYRCCGDGPQNVGSGLRLRERKNDYEYTD